MLNVGLCSYSSPFHREQTNSRSTGRNALDGMAQGLLHNCPATLEYPSYHSTIMCFTGKEIEEGNCMAHWYLWEGPSWLGEGHISQVAEHFGLQSRKMLDPRPLLRLNLQPHGYMSYANCTEAWVFATSTHWREAVSAVESLQGAGLWGQGSLR